MAIYSQTAILREPLEERNADTAAYHIVDQWQYIAKLDLAEDIYDYGYQVIENNNLANSIENRPVTADENFDLDTSRTFLAVDARIF